MGDVISVVSLVAGLVPLIMELHKVSIKYCLGVKHASKTMQFFLSELTALKKVLGDIETLNSTYVKNSSSTQQALDACEICFAELDAILAKMKKNTTDNHFAASMKRLTWPIAEYKTKMVMDRVRRNLENVRAGLQIDAFKATRKSLSMFEESQYREIMQWLSPSDMQSKHDDTSSKHQPNTGQWFLRDPTFVRWFDCKDSKSVLWCPGKPGSGKSVMTALALSHVRKEVGSRDVNIACFYCDHKDTTTQRTYELVSSLTKQLLQKESKLPSEVIDLYEKAINGGGRPRLKDIESILLALCPKSKKTFLFIDALDEFVSKDERTKFFSVLQALEAGSIRVFLTSRANHDDINRGLHHAARIDIAASEEDIRSYLDSKIKEDKGFDSKLSAELRREVIDSMTDRASGMFLLPVLHLEQVRHERTETAIRKAMKEIPTGLTETYLDIVQRIKWQVKPDQQLGIRILEWICYSRRQLSVDELRHALSVDLQTRKDGQTIEVDRNNIQDEQSLLDVCGGLVVIKKQSNIVRFVHPTAEAFFESSKRRLFPDAEARIAKTCVVYLSSAEFGQGYCRSDEEFRARKLKFPFFEYAAKFWGDHMRRKFEERSSWILRLLDNKDSLSSFVQGLVTSDQRSQYECSQRFPKRCTKLHLASAFGLTSIVNRILDEEFDIDATDDYGQTSLHWASQFGRQQVVKILLSRGAKKDAQTQFKKTPLHLASQKGFRTIVRLLLARGSSPNLQDQINWTALHYSTINGHLKVSEILLRNGADIEAKDWIGRRALHWASEKGQSQIIRLLLDHDAEVDASTNDGWTALHQAAEENHEEACKLLISRGASINRRTDIRRNFLSFVCARGNVHLVQFGLDNGADVNIKDADGFTPLHIAALANSPALVSILAHAGADLNARTADEHFISKPLPKTAFEPEIQNLLEQYDYPDMVRRYHRKTALLQAMEKGHESIMQRLQKANFIPAGRVGGDTALLHWAAATGHERLVELLLRRDNIIEERQRAGMTALHYAAERGHDQVVKRLIRCGAERDAVNEHGDTPADLAKEAGNEQTRELVCGTKNDAIIVGRQIGEEVDEEVEDYDTFVVTGVYALPMSARAVT